MPPLPSSTESTISRIQPLSLPIQWLPPFAQPILHFPNRYEPPKTIHIFGSRTFLFFCSEPNWGSAESPKRVQLCRIVDGQQFHPLLIALRFLCFVEFRVRAHWSIHHSCWRCFWESECTSRPYQIIAAKRASGLNSRFAWSYPQASQTLSQSSHPSSLTAWSGRANVRAKRTGPWAGESDGSRRANRTTLGIRGMNML